MLYATKTPKQYVIDFVLMSLSLTLNIFTSFSIIYIAIFEQLNDYDLLLF